ncbi:MAG: hypothetical protein WCD35_19550 [Mycobacteriales bacterium]
MIRSGGVVALVLLVAGCSGSSPAPRASRTPTPAPVRSSPAVPSPAATAGAAATPTARALPAAGSTDFGYVTGVVSASAPVRLSFDRALFLTGAAANKAAAAHGDETPVPNDYYVVNDSTRLRTLELAAGVRVLGSLGLNSFVGDNTVALRPRTLAELLSFVRTPPGRQTGFRLVYGSGGLVVRIEEQYVP